METPPTEYRETIHRDRKASKGPSWRQNAFMAAQVHAKVALSDFELVPIWVKLGSRQLKVSLSCH